MLFFGISAVLIIVVIAWIATFFVSGITAIGAVSCVIFTLAAICSAVLGKWVTDEEDNK